MMVAVSASQYAFMDHLARSQSGQLLREALGHRWPETQDELAAIIRYALVPAGKLVRPMMALHATEAVGGEPRDVLPAALGMEYVHVATLVHDDIIDADDTRRGRPSVAAAYGVPHAIVAGDHLIFNAFESIVECGATIAAGHVLAAVGVLGAAGVDLCRGQALESRLAGDPASGVAAYLDMIRMKTGALFRAVCQIGALLGGAEPATARRLARYGEHVGMAFQIRDDLLAYTETRQLSGKPATSDLANGRPTLPVLLAYEAGTDEQRGQLRAALTKGHTDEEDLARIGVLLHETSALTRAREQATALAGRARAELSTLTPGPSVDVLTGITHWASTKGS